MSLQNEKLKLIEWLLGVKDLSTLRMVAELRTQSLYKDLPKFSIEEIQSRALKSEEAIKQGDCTTFDDLKVEMESW